MLTSGRCTSHLRGTPSLNSNPRVYRIAEVERVHRTRTNGEFPDEESQNDATRSAYPDLTTFEAWAAKQTTKKKKAGSGDNKKDGWNNVSLVKLVMGKH